jgi:serine/threonine protein phosphatase 1
MIWAIGDVHGCYNKMISLVEKIPKTEKIIFLGDYVDRGPAIDKVCEFVNVNIDNPRFVFLMGNHEEMMFNATQSPDHMEGWLLNGGKKTQEQVGDKFELYCDLFRGLRDRYETEHNYFVHGGLSPGVSFDKQSRDVILWYRTKDDYNHGKHLIHGHTPQKGNIEQLTWRTNIDTGAVFGYKLTAVKIEMYGQITEVLQA